MGYYMDQIDGNFRVKKENLDKMFEAIKNIPNESYAWIDDFKNCDNIRDILLEWRWETYFDENGNIWHLSFDGQKLGDDEVLFHAIAPFVEAGSYICMRGEDDTLWKWYFDGEHLREFAGRIVWDDEI